MNEMNDQMIAEVVDRLRALADENRVRLLLRLKHSPANVTTLTRDLGINQASASKHLTVLKQAGLVAVDRVGTQAIYRVDDETVFDMCRLVCDGVVRHLRKQQAVLEAVEKGS